MDLSQIKGIDIQNYDIMYNDIYHTYFHTVENKKLPSVTQLLGSFKKPYDSEYWSKVKAKEKNITQKQQLKEWEDSRIIGSTTGTITHNYLENAIKNKIINFSVEEKDYVTEAINRRLNNIKFYANSFIKDFKFNKVNIPIAQECVVGNTLFAGQLDYFGYDLSSEKFVIIDYKTDLEFTTESKYKWLKPLSHIQDTKLNKYSIQVSMYQKAIMEMTGLEEKDIIRKIIWINENNDSYIVIPVDYMKKEVEIILNNLK